MSSSSTTSLTPENYIVNRRGDGAVLVRVVSRPLNGATPPDAVFTFRPGDPQFKYWDQQAAKSPPLSSSG
jgi:hypothetical protein